MEEISIENPIIINDKNFEKLYSLISMNVFNDNISDIIKNGYSDRLVQIIENEKISYLELKVSFFDDEVWNIINKNQISNGVSILEIFENKLDTLVQLIKKGLFEGFKYTYELIPESHNFIKTCLNLEENNDEIFGKNEVALEQFSFDFISNIGIDTLKKLYKNNNFENADAKKIFKIASYGNYELIQDIINYDNYARYKNISEKDMEKKLLETNINNYNKNEVFLNKYFGLERREIYYIKLFLNAINKVETFPLEFKEKYGNIL